MSVTSIPVQGLEACLLFDVLKITEVPSIVSLNLLSPLPYQCGRSCYTHRDICSQLSSVDSLAL